MSKNDYLRNLKIKFSHGVLNFIYPGQSNNSITINDDVSKGEEMKNLLCILFTTLTINTAAYAGPIPSGQRGEERMKKCVKLLPDGHSYSINIKVTADRKSPDQKDIITQELNISDETRREVGEQRHEEVKPFIQCMIDNVL
ncbi:hypothetical protein ACL2XP_24225 [Sodalis sp. RH21]|uniref:hypothetical protein n=1 Tax=unclassified Sodalis (in: enterobacteria) TaxID=2636512 RepID=UPI0039B60CBB